MYGIMKWDEGLRVLPNIKKIYGYIQ